MLAVLLMGFGQLLASFIWMTTVYQLGNWAVATEAGSRYSSSS
jgi:hypothetical protein